MQENTTPEAGTQQTTPTFDETYYKNQLSSLSAQIASKDKKLKESNKLYQSKLSEDEKIKIAMEAKDTELESLRRDKTVLGYSNSLTANGFDAKRASEMAGSIADGDMDGFLKGFNGHMAELEKTLKAGLVNNTPPPPSGNNSTVTLESQLKQAFEAGDNLKIVQIKQEMEKTK